MISREYPMEWTPELEPYYTINDERNMKIFSQYKELANGLRNEYLFGGRPADYAYYDMAPTIEHSFKLYEKEINNG